MNKNKDNKSDKPSEFDREAQKYQKKKNVHPSKMIDETEDESYRIHGPVDAQDLLEDFE